MTSSVFSAMKLMHIIQPLRVARNAWFTPRMSAFGCLSGVLLKVGLRIGVESVKSARGVGSGNEDVGGVCGVWERL